MIFVTVGTHEQQFDRLLVQIDKLKENKIILEDIFMQIGYSTYIPKYCEWERILSYREMEQFISDARIVITHGGPSSFIAPIQKGKIPIVVPRQHKFGEHVNDHQLEFCRKVSERQGNIILVEDIDSLQSMLENYDEIAKKMTLKKTSNNNQFNNELEKLINELF